VKYARVVWRAFLHDRSKAGFVRFIEPVMRKGTRQKPWCRWSKI
jgi:hypothetical protein